MEKRVVLILFVILIVIVAILALYFTFFKAKKCYDSICFDTALTKCRKASYINDAEDAAWLYNIEGKSNGECKVNVKLARLKQGTNEMKVLEGKEMVCYLPLGSMKEPQSNLAKCSGSLKEEMQTIIINKLHSYIVSNLGQISEELGKVI